MVVHSIQLCKVGQKKRTLGGMMFRKVIQEGAEQELLTPTQDGLA